VKLGNKVLDEARDKAREHAGSARDVSAAQARSWHHRDLTHETGAPDVAGDLVAFPVNGTDPRLYYPGGDDHVHELAYYQGGWHHRDITAAAGARVVRRGRLAGFAMNGTEPRVYHDDYDDHVHELAYHDGRWHDRDLTAEAGAPASSIAAIAAFQATSTDPRVYYMNYDGHVGEFSHWQQRWHHRDLTADVGAPEAALFALVAFTAGGADSRVYHLDRDGHVHELSYWQGRWHHRDLVRDIGAPAADGNLLAGFTVGGPDSRIYYMDTSEHVRELSYWQGRWHHRDLTEDVGAVRPESAGLAGFPMGSGGDARVYSKGTYTGHIYEYAFYDGGWHYQDVTDSADAPTWGGGGTIEAFLVAGSDPRVYYYDNTKVNELASFVDAPSEPPGPQTRTVRLQRQIIWEGFVPYLGQFPAFGVVSPGRLVGIEVPRIGLVDRTVLFVKAGRSTAECNNPAAVVALDEGQSATPDQIQDIFGQSQPRFSSGQPLSFLACVGTAGDLPDWLDIEITVRFD